MAESISEGTLKQFSKSIGDYVEQDEEIASIETDKIDVAVNAPVAGTIKEFLVKEEDTVTVGQDLLKLETGGSPGEAKEETAKSEPKAAAPEDQPTASQPDGKKEQEAPKEDKEKKSEKPAESMPEPPKEKDQPKEQPKPATPPPKKDDAPKSKEPKELSKQPEPTTFGGSRGENRVSWCS